LSKKIKIIVEERIIERHTCFGALPNFLRFEKKKFLHNSFSLMPKALLSISGQKK
jgi:hypothetical protein